MTNFSETYYPTIQGYRLTPDQHKANNQWFAEMLDKLKDDGILYIPVLHRSFNKKGEEDSKKIKVFRGGSSKIFKSLL